MIRYSSIPARLYASITLAVLGSCSYAVEATLGVESGYYSYVEPGVMSMKGPLVGIHGSILGKLGEPRADGVTVGLWGRAAYTATNYTSKDTGSINSGIPSYIGNIKPTIGYRFSSYKQYRINPYIGAGYRFLFNNFDGFTTSTGHNGFNRYSNYLYIPIGTRASYHFTRHYGISGHAEFDWMVWGRQVSAIHNTINNDQRNGYGLNGSLLFENYLGPGFSLGIGPYSRYWYIPESEQDKGFVEPQNSTLEVGLKLNMSF